MPELPEVETTRRGITPHVKNKKVENVIIRQASLRWPVPRNLKHKLTSQKITDIRRRAKYFIICNRYRPFDHSFGHVWKFMYGETSDRTT